MKIIKTILILLVFPNFIFGQKDSSEIARFGFIASIDLTYNFQDKVLNPGLGRKWLMGASFTNKKKQFVVFAAVGIKGAKLNAYTPTFRKTFISDVQQNYVPIMGTSEDSLIGAKMNGNPGKSVGGSYSQYFSVGLILNKNIKPSLSFYMGREEFIMFDRGFAKYEDPEHGDIDYVGMSTLFYEIKVGCGIPLKFIAKNPRALNLNVGYKWVDYGSMSFNKTPLSAYTKGALADKYNNASKLTLSISYILWTNWKLFQ